MSELILRVVCLCLALAGVETLHGIARMRFLVPRIGRLKAQRISIVTGSLLALAVCVLGVPSLGLHTPASLLALGMGLSAFMACFDLCIGRYAARLPWKRVLADFNPWHGNLLSLGLLLLVFFPLLVMSIR